MQKSILYPILYISLSISGLSVAIAAIDNTVMPTQTYVSYKLAIISQMYKQDAESEGFGDIPILVEYGTSELQAALALEQDYYDRTQMSCNVGFDILWHSQDPDYAQDKQITMTDTGLVKVSLTQARDVYYELVCDNTNYKNNNRCQIDDVIFSEDISLKAYLFEQCR